MAHLCPRRDFSSPVFARYHSIQSFTLRRSWCRTVSVCKLGLRVQIFPPHASTACLLMLSPPGTNELPLLVFTVACRRKTPTCWGPSAGLRELQARAVSPCTDRACEAAGRVWSDEWPAAAEVVRTVVAARLAASVMGWSHAEARDAIMPRQRRHHMCEKRRDVLPNREVRQPILDCAARDVLPIPNRVRSCEAARCHVLRFS